MYKIQTGLIGRFLILAVISLIILLPLWWWAAKWFAAVPIWIAGNIMTIIFPWAESFEQEGTSAVLHTLVQVRVAGINGDMFGEISPDVPYPVYGYGIVLLWAMLISSHTPKWWLKGILASLALMPLQAIGICFQWLRDLAFKSGPEAAAYLGYSQISNELIAYGYQFSFLMLTPVAPILLWLAFNKSFVAALWLEASLDGSAQELHK